MNYWFAGSGVLQLAGAVYAAMQGQYKLSIVYALIAVANILLSTVKA